MNEAEQHFANAAVGDVPHAPGRVVDMLGGVDRVEFVPGLAFQPALGEQTMATKASVSRPTRPDEIAAHPTLARSAGVSAYHGSP